MPTTKYPAAPSKVETLYQLAQALAIKPAHNNPSAPERTVIKAVAIKFMAFE
jgi:hypothetical protein